MKNSDRYEAIRQSQLTRYIVDEVTGCWIWTGGRSRDGYGKVKRYRKTIRAHRMFYEYHTGPIPEGLVVMHSCDTPLCVNPKHLKCGTHLENEEDKDRKGRRSPPPSISHPERMPRGEAHPCFGRPMLAHVKEAIRRANVGRPLSTKHKENLSSLTVDQVKAILEEPGPNRVIATKYGVHPNTIQKIRGGVRWTHLTGLGSKSKTKG